MDAQQAHRKHIGILGEHIARTFLRSKGFSIRDRNYREKWGELDIIAEKSGVIYFVEVKTVARDLATAKNANEGFSPEDNIHTQKIKRIIRTANSYLISKDGKDAPRREWQIDAIVVFLDTKQKKATVRHIECIS